MGNRMLKESIRTSKKVNQLSDFEYRLWSYLITYVDDYGRGPADTAIIKGFVFPLRKNVTEKNIGDALIRMESIGLINLYTADGESYLCFPNWSNHQRIQTKRSKYPEPTKNEPFHGDPPKSTVTHGDPPPETKPIQTKSNRNQIETETEYEPACARACEGVFVDGSNQYRPDPKDVQEYIAAKGYHFDAQDFMDYYDAVDWMQKGQPIKNWMSKCSVFERNWKKRQQGSAKSSVVVPMPDYIRGQENRQKGDDTPPWLQKED